MNSEDDNIVKKVFDRTRDKGEKISPLFMRSKSPMKVLSPGGDKGVSSLNRLPVAVDLGTSSVKLVQLSQLSKDDFETVVSDEETYGVDTKGDLVSRQKEALQRISARNRVGPNAIVGLSAKEVQIFNFVFPGMSPAELDEAVRWKLKQLRPFGVDFEKIRHAVIPWENRSGGVSGATEQRVTVVCASSETLFKKIEILAHAGLKAVAIDVTGLSLANTKKFKNPYPSPEGVTLWLDLGAEETTLVVEKGGVALFLKNLTVTSRQLTRQLAQTCHIEETRAEGLKKLHGLSFWSADKESGSLETVKLEKKEDEPAAIFYGIVSHLESLVIDIEHSFKNFSYQVSSSGITQFDRVILTGGGANMVKLDLFLKSKLGVPVEKNESAIFSGAMSLALASVLPKAKAINLLPSLERRTTERKAINFKTNPRKVAILAAALGLLLLGPPIAKANLMKTQADTLEKEVKIAKTELGQLQSEQLKLAEEETKLLDQKKLFEAKLELLKASSDESHQFAPVLTKFAALLPEEMWVTQMSFKEKKLTVTGLTLKNDLIVNFISELKKSEDFREITFNYAQKEPNSSIYRFEVMMGVR